DRAELEQERWQAGAPCHLALDLVDASSERIVPRVEGADVGIQAIATLLKLTEGIAGGARRANAAGPFQRRSELANDLAFVCLEAVRLQAVIREPNLLEALIDDLERGHFLADEEHSFASRQTLGD